MFLLHLGALRSSGNSRGDFERPLGDVRELTEQFQGIFKIIEKTFVFQYFSEHGGSTAVDPPQPPFWRSLGGPEDPQEASEDLPGPVDLAFPVGS